MTHGHFESTFWQQSKYAFERGEGVTKNSTLCTLVKMMTIMDDPLSSFQSMSLLHHEYHRNLTFAVIWSGSQYQMLFLSNFLSIDSLISSTRSINACIKHTVHFVFGYKVCLIVYFNVKIHADFKSVSGQTQKVERFAKYVF